MWKTLIFQGTTYLFEILIIENNVILKVTDLHAIWSYKTTKENLIEEFQKWNPLLADEPDQMFNMCTSLLKENLIDSITFDITQSCILKFKTTIDELPIKFKAALGKEAENEFFKMVSIPMVKTIQYLELKQKKLESLLKNKDKELMEYKLEYGNITRKMLETKEYVTDAQEKEELMLKVFTDDEKFTELFSEEHGDVQELFPEIKLDKKPSAKQLKLPPLKYKRSRLQ